MSDNKIDMTTGSLDQAMRSCRYVTLNEVMEIVKAEMDIASSTSGHGKAQKAFGRKILERIGDLK